MDLLVGQNFGHINWSIFFVHTVNINEDQSSYIRKLRHTLNATVLSLDYSIFFEWILELTFFKVRKLKSRRLLLWVKNDVK